MNHHVKNLYFLHAAALGTDGNIGKYIVNYEDGQREELDIVIPVNNHNWWAGFADKRRFPSRSLQGGKHRERSTRLSVRQGMGMGESSHEYQN